MKTIRDVSFAGAKVTVAGQTLEDFMDDANPVEFPDTEVSTVGVNCNGNMIRNAKPNVIMMSVTVIPCSPDDAFLYKLWRKYRVQDGVNNAGQWETALTANIHVQGNNKSKNTWNFTNGTMVSGPGGPSSNGEGKMQGRTYTFAFVSVDD
jgi:hypothetical protein